MMDEPTVPQESNDGPVLDRKFVTIVALVAVLFALLPAIFALATAPSGSHYVGYQYNTDDHMVYSAWMRQAMDGRFFFDNRFTTDTQPGLTVHIYFFVLGLIAKVTGIPLAATLGRIGFGVLFVFLAARLIRSLGWSGTASRLALVLTMIGGGLGFLVWHSFGLDIVKDSPLKGLMLGRLPTDVWQPEGFVFPSLLTNGLFMVSLCLILLTFEAFLKARTSLRSAVYGALAIGALMNIHSYDALMIGLVMVGFVAASLVKKQLTGGWIGRAVLIAAGMLPAALWFVHVLRNDPVFQARAATETFSPNFRPVFFGYLLLMIPALIGAYKIGGEPANRKRRSAAIGLIAFLYIALFFMATSHTGGYFLSAPVFGVVFLLSVIAVAMAATDNPTWNLFFAWAVIGTVAIYFPGLFQRKLAMGLSIPWAILAAYGLAELVGKLEANSRRLCFALTYLVLGASSARWLLREVSFIQANVANTGRDPVYLPADIDKILTYLNGVSGRKVVLALTGSLTPAVDANGQPIVDELSTPIIPDWSPFASGLTGAYTYAGHWSETPDYNNRIKDVNHFFRRGADGNPSMDADARKAFEAKTGANYAIVQHQGSLPIPLLVSLELGEVVVSGANYDLVKLR